MTWSRSLSGTPKPPAPALPTRALAPLALVPFVMALVLAALLLPAAAAAAAVPDGPWVSPLAGPLSVSRAFDPPDTPYGAGHRGVDLASPSGSSVRSAGAGTVSYATLLAGRGVVVVVHGDLRTTYEPVTASVEVGQRVAAGAVIGTLDPGHASCAPATCLHWGLRRGDTYLDPLRLLRRAPSVLLPVSSADRSQVGAAARRGATHRTAFGLLPADGRAHAGSGDHLGDRPATEAVAPRSEASGVTDDPDVTGKASDDSRAAAEARDGSWWALRSADRPLGVAALLGLLAGVALISRSTRDPRPSPPTAPLAPAGSAGPSPTLTAAPSLQQLPTAPLDLATERLRRRPA